MAKHPAIKPVAPGKKINMLIYGWPGVGKTPLIGQPGTLILRPPTDHTDSVSAKGVDEWVISNYEDTAEVEEFLRHNPDEYKWVWLDSISLLQDHLLDDIWAMTIARYQHRKDGPIDKGEYNLNFTRLSRWVRNLVGMPGYNFGIVAHPRDTAGEEDADAKLWPWVQGKNMPFKICGYMNVIGYMEVINNKGKTRRIIRFEETERYVAKDQYQAFEGGRLVDPTMQKIEAALASKRPTQRPRRRTIKKG